MLFDVREHTLQGIGGIGDGEFRMTQVDEQVWKVPLYAVIGTPDPAMGVVPFAGEIIDGSFLEKASPLVVPYLQPQCELRFINLRKESHQRLQVLSCFKLRFACDVARDDGALMEMAHLHRNGKALQQATSAITDDGSDVPASLLQLRNAMLVRIDGFVGKKLPQEILLLMRAPPHHDAEEPLEVRGVHDDDHFVRCWIPLVHHDVLQMTLHPFRAAPVLPRYLHMGLFAVRKFLPDLCRVFFPFFATFPTASFAFPNLSTIVRAVLLKRCRIATRTYFS